MKGLIEYYFPYEGFRKFQREIAESIYNALSSRRTAIIEAPTGVGKTACALAASLAFCEEEGCRVLFLVRTRNEAQAPVRELLRLRKKGVDVSFVVLKGRPDMCCLASERKLPYEEFLEECRSLRKSGHCPYYKSVSRTDVKALVEEAFEASGGVKDYVDYLCGMGVCPYEISKEYLKEARVSIMTYFYAFSLKKPESLDIDFENSVLIIDEAHNLPEAVSGLNSTSISITTVNMAIGEVKRFLEDEELKVRALKVLKGIQSYMNRLSEAFEEDTFVSLDLAEVMQLFDDYEAIARSYYEVLRRKRSSNNAIPYTPLSKIIEFYKAIMSRASGFEVFAIRDEAGISLVYKCIDPSIITEPVFSKAKGVVLISGTMPPRDYVTAMLGITRPTLDYRIGFREYIAEGNYEVYIYDAVTTRYVERNEREYARIGEALCRLYRAFNCDKAILSIFPSYNVLKAVRKYVSPDVKCIVELSSTSVDDVIEALESDSRRLIMAVAGGKLTEGVEFRRGHENLLGMVVVVGVPYPEPNEYLDSVMGVLTARLGDRRLAWELTYQWPAIVRVKQAIGRAFRSENDKALIILMDRRFKEGRLARTIEEYFGGYKVVGDIEELEEAASRFCELFFYDSR